MVGLCSTCVQNIVFRLIVNMYDVSAQGVDERMKYIHYYYYYYCVVNLMYCSRHTPLRAGREAVKKETEVSERERQESRP